METLLEKKTHNKRGGEPGSAAGTQINNMEKYGLAGNDDKPEHTVEKNTWRYVLRLYLFVLLSLIYWEMLLVPGHRIPITATSVLYIALFSASTAAVFTFLSTLWKREKANLID